MDLYGSAVFSFIAGMGIWFDSTKGDHKVWQCRNPCDAVTAICWHMYSRHQQTSGYFSTIRHPLARYPAASHCQTMPVGRPGRRCVTNKPSGRGNSCIFLHHFEVWELGHDRLSPTTSKIAQIVQCYEKHLSNIRTTGLRFLGKITFTGHRDML